MSLRNGAREVARITGRQGRQWVLAEQGLPGPTPWVTWEVDADDNAYHGHYFADRDSATADLLERVIL